MHCALCSVQYHARTRPKRESSRSWNRDGGMWNRHRTRGRVGTGQLALGMGSWHWALGSHAFLVLLVFPALLALLASPASPYRTVPLETTASAAKIQEPEQGIRVGPQAHAWLLCSGSMPSMISPCGMRQLRRDRWEHAPVQYEVQ